MPHTFVIFGASGNLTSRKLVPALFQLERKGRLPEGTKVVGFSRSPFTHDTWRNELAGSTSRLVGTQFDSQVWHRLAERIYYQPGDLSVPATFGTLTRLLDDVEKGSAATRIYYLATAPQFYQPAAMGLNASGLADTNFGPRRIVVEKPFGTDLDTAQALNAVLHGVFAEGDIYRIDHYLGKETVQNLLVMRFANTIFEPVWNRNFIDHVQITVAEEVDVGRRGSYYDSAGVIRDMFQNHLLQLMTIAAMEPPAKYEADAIRDEKVKVLQAVRPLCRESVHRDTFRGQYQGYATSDGVSPGSDTATFAAIKLWIDNWRWQGVPFYLRSGKAMSCRTTQIVIQFREPPHMIFPDGPRGTAEANRLVIQVQPAEGIQLHFQSKVPDAGMKLRQTDLEFRFCRDYRGTMPEAYERLLLDAMEGDASLFARADEVEAAWRICDWVLDYWRAYGQPTLFQYEPAGWGPVACRDWMAADGRQWFDACPVLT
jgi:glucose-6-phosphate 1-dehydrogenase